VVVEVEEKKAETALSSLSMCESPVLEDVAVCK
jgi:hypothetical protein